MREREVDRLFVRECKRRGIVTYKISSWANRGVYDRLLLGPGKRFALVELKSTDGKLTRHQKTFGTEARDAGLNCGVLRAGATASTTRALIAAWLDDYMLIGRCPL